LSEVVVHLTHLTNLTHCTHLTHLAHRYGSQVKNYILPCNSVPVNDNLVIEWDDDGTIQDDLWKLVMQERFSDKLHLGNDAAAKEISRWARSQKDDWVRKTEKTLEEDL